MTSNSPRISTRTTMKRQNNAIGNCSSTQPHERKRLLASSRCISTTATSMILMALAMLSYPVDGFVPHSSVLLGTKHSYLFTRRTEIPIKTAARRTISPIRSAASTCLNALKMNSSSGSSSEKKTCTELEFEMQVGRALDTLRKDYVKLLEQPPDYSLYGKDIELVDPSGVSVHGLRSYQNAFRLLHTLIKFVYCPEKSAMTSVRMCYDPIKRNIRIHWNAQVIPREIFGGSRSILYVDGISIYEFDRKTGEIDLHRFEKLIMNNMAVKPEEGVVAALRQYHGVTVPNYIQTEPPVLSSSSSSQQTPMHGDMFLAPFQTGVRNSQDSLFSSSHTVGSKDSKSSSTTPLYSFEASSDGGSDGSESAAASSSSLVNVQALESKNKSRKKFGLAPLTPEEFLRLESHVKAMDAEQQLKRQQQQAAAAAAKEQKQKKGSGMFQNLFGSVLKDTCESNYDCERPEICCDFGFKKMCCSSGSPVGQSLQGQYATVPVPVGTEDFPGQNSRGPRRY